MAISTFSIVLTVTAATQAIADANRDAGLADYCKAYKLDIYVTPKVPASGIAPAKAAAAIRAHVQQHFRDVIAEFRGQDSGETAKLAAKATAATEFA